MKRCFIMLIVAAAAGYAFYLYEKNLPAVVHFNGGTTAARWWRGEQWEADEGGRSCDLNVGVWLKHAAGISVGSHEALVSVPVPPPATQVPHSRREPDAFFRVSASCASAKKGGMVNRCQHDLTL